jgi:adenosine kinase
MDKKYAKPMPDQFFQAARLGVLTVGSYQDNLEFFNKCKKHDLPLVFGMKCDFDAFPKEFFTEVIHYSRIIFTNRMEREEIEKRLGLRSIADLLDRGRAEVIVTTLGAQGSVCYHKSHGELVVNEVEAANFGPVVDTTGSGDAFIAGFLYGYLTGKPVQECGELGSVLASFVIEQPGSCSNAPSEAEFQQRYAQFISRRTAEDD